MNSRPDAGRLPARESEARTFVKVAAVLLVLATAMAGALAWSVAEAGIATVHVREKSADGHSFWIPLPMSLAAAAVHMAPDDMLDDESDEDLGDMQEFLPMIARALEDLDVKGDFTLIEVEGPGEHVRIVKSGRSLLIHVEDEDDEVSVSFPIRSFARLFREVEVKAGRVARAREAEEKGDSEQNSPEDEQTPAPAPSRAKSLSY